MLGLVPRGLELVLAPSTRETAEIWLVQKTEEVMVHNLLVWSLGEWHGHGQTMVAAVSFCSVSKVSEIRADRSQTSKQGAGVFEWKWLAKSIMWEATLLPLPPEKNNGGSTLC